MSVGNTRRVIGGVSAFAVAAGFAVTAGVGVAGAAPGSVTWADGGSNFVRTVSNVTPIEGEIVTTSMKFMRTGAVEYIQAVKDYHPACLTYVEGSAKVDGSAKGLESQGADFARVTGSWAVYPNIEPKSHTFEFSYKVGAGCDRGVAMNTWVDYSGSLGSGGYSNKAIAVTVSKNVTTAALAAVPAGVKVGQSVPLTATITGGVDGNVVEFFDGTTKIGQGPLAAGKATLAWTPTTAGGRSLTAKFLGTTKANESVSAAQNVAVSPADVVTTTTVTGPATAVAGADVTLNVQVSPAPTGGTVQFKDGATNLGGPVTLDAQGKGSTTQKFAVGTRSVTAVYAGSAQFLTSTSTALPVAVSPADVATTTTVTGPATAVAGADVTLAAQVSPTPSGGTVQFKDGATDLGAPVAVDAAGKASITQKFVAGDRQITAVYSGAGEFLTSSSAAHTVAVSPAEVATTTTVTGPDSAVAGADVTLNVNVSPVPSGGTVQFKNGTADLGSPVTLDAQGNGSITQKFAAAGAQSITAVYSGAGEFLTSASAAHSVAVSPADVATTTTVTGPATAVAGADVTLAAQVSPTPSGGTVQFKDGATDLGAPVAVDAAGKASITQQFVAGDRAITAVFSGAGEFLTSSSAAHTVAVSPAEVATTTTVTGPDSAVAGADVTLNVNVSPVPSGGTVQFKNGTADLGSPVTLDAQGNGSITQKFAAAGAQSITAVYSGAGEFLTSASAAHSVAVSLADVATTTTVTGPATAVAGADVTLAAQVSPTPSGGTVQFKDGATDLGGPVAVDASGKASITQQFVAGDRAITAVFSGAGEFLTSTSAAHTVAVSPPAPVDVATTTVVTGPATAVEGSDVTLSAQVSPTPSGGTVQFKDGADNLGGPVDVDASGKASITQQFVAGDRAITAVFSGAGEFLTSTSAAHTVAVSPPAPVDVATTTTVTGPATAVAGTDVTLAAQVSPTPSGGTVQFKDGTTNLGGPVDVDAAGKASITQKFVVGNRQITAVFSGAAEFLTSTSAAHALSVTPPAPVGEVTTTNVTGPATANTGVPVDLRAKVTVGSNGAPIASGGTITFKDGGTVIGKTTNVIGGQAQLTHTFTTAGAHSVTAEFSGITGTFLASVSQPLPVQVTATVVDDVVTTTVLKVPATATTGVAVNLIATVSPSPIGGTVQFKDGENNIGTPLALVNGKATRSYAFPIAGDHQVTAVYSGAAGFLTSSAEAVTVPVVDPPVKEEGAGGSLGALFGSS